MLLFLSRSGFQMLFAVSYRDVDTVRSLFRQCVSAREEVESDTVWRGAKIFGPGKHPYRDQCIRQTVKLS